MDKSLRIILIITLLTLMMPSCTNDMEIINRFIDAEIEPDLVAYKVETLYSDSARLQMKMITPLMKQFNSAVEQREEFPEGLNVWFYENNGDFKAQITADWARHDRIISLWEARGNVELINAEGQRLETEQLFWDTERGIAYSEKFTKITSPDGQVATGDTFTARQDFSEWRLMRGRATIFFNDEVNED